MGLLVLCQDKVTGQKHIKCSFNNTINRLKNGYDKMDIIKILNCEGNPLVAKNIVLGMCQRVGKNKDTRINDKDNDKIIKIMELAIEQNKQNVIINNNFKRKRDSDSEDYVDKIYLKTNKKSKKIPTLAIPMDEESINVENYSDNDKSDMIPENYLQNKTNNFMPLYPFFPYYQYPFILPNFYTLPFPSNFDYSTM